MQPVWLRFQSGKQFEETFENTHWREAKQMQSMWLYMLRSKCIEVTFEDTQWINQRAPVQLPNCDVRAVLQSCDVLSVVFMDLAAGAGEEWRPVPKIDNCPHTQPCSSSSSQPKIWTKVPNYIMPKKKLLWKTKHKSEMHHIVDGVL